MDHTPAAAHAGHDELLIARLFGGDVDPGERARAVALMVECVDCAALFADLGATAEATAALPVPSRPRDFSLTEEDAARLGRRSRRWPAFSGLGLRRSLGGSLAALGLAGLILTSTVSVLGGMVATSGTTAADLHQDSLGVTAAGSAEFNANGGVPAAAATEASAPTAGPASSVAAAPPLPSSATQPTGGADASTRENSTAAPVDQASPGTGPAFAGVTSGTKSAGGANGTEQTSLTSKAAGNGVDARLVWLVGFGLLFAIGLALLLLPRILRRRDRGA
jgi:hypothetical protein